MARLITCDVNYHRDYFSLALREAWRCPRIDGAETSCTHTTLQTTSTRLNTTRRQTPSCCNLQPPSQTKESRNYTTLCNVLRAQESFGSSVYGKYATAFACIIKPRHKVMHNTLASYEKQTVKTIVLTIEVFFFFLNHIYMHTNCSADTMYSE